jgi:hypothetical protein
VPARVRFAVARILVGGLKRLRGHRYSRRCGRADAPVPPI